MWGHGFWGGPWSVPWWWGLIMMIFWLVILVGIAVFIAWLVRQVIGREPRSGTNRALEILQERYARGEITREQYEQMRRDLLGGVS